MAEGVVGVKSYRIKEGLKEFISEKNVNANEQARISKEKLEEMVTAAIKEKYREWIEQQKEKDIEFLHELKIKEIYRYERLINLAKSRFGVTDEQIKQFIGQYRSQEEYKKELRKYPIISERLIKKIDDINKEIEKLEPSE